jgi:hypothetical protein
VKHSLKQLTKLHRTEAFKHSRFSRANLVVFAVIFACVGGCLLYSSFAATVTCDVDNIATSAALDSAVSNSANSGKTICVTANVNANHTWNTSFASQTTIIAKPADWSIGMGHITFNGNADNITVQGFDFNGAGVTVDANNSAVNDINNIRIIKNHIHDIHGSNAVEWITSFPSIHIVNPQVMGNLIERISSSNNASNAASVGYGIYEAGGQTIGPDTKIDYNTFDMNPTMNNDDTHQSADAMQLKLTGGFEIKGNLIEHLTGSPYPGSDGRNSHADSLMIWASSSGGLIQDNRLIDGTDFLNSPDGSNMTMINNLIVRQSQQCVDSTQNASSGDKVPLNFIWRQNTIYTCGGPSLNTNGSSIGTRGSNQLDRNIIENLNCSGAGAGQYTVADHNLVKTNGCSVSGANNLSFTPAFTDTTDYLPTNLPTGYSDAGYRAAPAGYQAYDTTGQSCNSVSQYGITWTFDKSYPCGQFANGDWWVAPNAGDSAVTITSMTPGFTGTRNGAEVNPTGNTDTSVDKQGYDSRLESFNAGNDPALPYAAHPNDSIIKTVSRSTNCGLSGTGNDQHAPCLDTAAVLTVMSTATDYSGDFRPSYAGTNKKLYTKAQLQTNLLPSLAQVTNVPSLSSETRRFQRVQMDDWSGWEGRYMHPTLNYSFSDTIGNPTRDYTSAYGAQIGDDTGDAALRLMLNDSLSAKMPLLINYVQAGIDYYGMEAAGINWGGNGGGHFSGRKTAGVFAATMLNDATMKANIQNDATTPDWLNGGHWGDEDTMTYYSSKTGRALWGRVGQDCDTATYENVFITETGASDCRDPDQMIDGGYDSNTYGHYQDCCTAMPWKGEALAALLLPGSKAVWNHNAFFDYEDRWVQSGFWMLPDDRTPARFSALHNTSANNGFYQSPFANAMWIAYRGSTSSTPKPADINQDGSVNITDLSLLLSSYSQTTTNCITNNTYVCDIKNDTPPSTVGHIDIFDLSLLLSGYGT